MISSCGNPNPLERRKPKLRTTLKSLARKQPSIEVFPQNQSGKHTPVKGDKTQLQNKVETSPSHIGSVGLIKKRRQRGLCQGLKMPLLPGKMCFRCIPCKETLRATA